MKAGVSGVALTSFPRRGVINPEVAHKHKAVISGETNMEVERLDSSAVRQT